MNNGSPVKYDLRMEPLRFNPELAESVIFGLKWSLGAVFEDPFPVRDVVVTVREIVDNPEEVKVEIIEEVDDALILNSLKEDTTSSHEEALLRIYTRLRPGNPPNLEKAKDLFREKFFDANRYRLGKVGRFRLSVTSAGVLDIQGHALKLMQRLQLQDPDDYWTNTYLSRIMYDQTPRRIDEAICAVGSGWNGRDPGHGG